MENPPRRAILQSLAVLSAGALAGRSVSSAPQSAAPQPARRIIDVHHHVYPPIYVTELARANQANALTAAKDWAVEKSLADMDQAGVATAIGSITTPGVSFADDALARRLARECNEFMARLAADHPGRFGFFAILPWPNADACLQEIAYALDTLHADGIGMLTNYGDKGAQAEGSVVRVQYWPWRSSAHQASARSGPTTNSRARRALRTARST